MALVIASGIGLVLILDTIGWGTAFVLIDIGVIVIDGVLQGAIFGPMLKKLKSIRE